MHPLMHPPTRRGQIELFTLVLILFELVLGLAIGYQLNTYFLKPLSENTHFEKVAIVNDIALSLDTILAIPSNARYTYTHTYLTTFDYRFATDVAIVDATPGPMGSQPLTLSKKSYFASPTRTLTAGPINKPTSITILKEDNTLEITSTTSIQSTPQLTKIACPPLPKKLNYIIDAGHGGLPKNPLGVDTGATQGNLIEADITRRILAEGAFAGFSTTRSAHEDQYLTPLARETAIKSSKATLISFHTGTHAASILAYIDATSLYAPQSAALACHILDSAATIKGIEHTHIIPINPATLDPLDTRRILLATPSGTYLEIGSMQTPQDAILTAQLAGPIGTTVRRTLEATR